MLKQRSLFTLLLLLLFVIPVTSAAQDEQKVSSLEIAIWPEYDRAAALVIYQVRLSGDGDTPARVTLPIPASAGDPHAVAAWYPDGRLDDSISWTATRQGDWTLVEVNSVTNGVWLEFYDVMAFSGDLREYVFTWTADLAVGDLRFDVLHPIGAQDLRITPEGEQRLGADGLIHSTLEMGAGQAGQSFSLELSYGKPHAFTGEVPALRSNPAMAQFEVGLWPEYDRAAVLVILRAGLAPNISLPATVSLPIPASAGEPNAVAVLGEDNRLFSTEYEQVIEGDWSWISFEADNRTFQLEYYDDLKMVGTNRSYTFFWPGALETGSFTYELQQPVGATGYVVTPAGARGAGADGLTYVRSSLGPQQVGSPLSISISYEKSSAALSVDAISAAPMIDRPSTTQGSTPNLTAMLPFILGGFGLALIVLVLMLYLRMARATRTRQKQSRPRKRKSKAKTTGVDLDASAVFCHICGAKASASDHFCRSCGTKLRQ